MEDFIVPLNLKSQREARKMTQEELAQALEITRVHVARLETGARGMSFVLALKCAKLFGSLKLRFGGEIFTIALSTDSGPNGGRDIPTTEEHENFDGVAHIVHTRNELAEGVRALESVLADIRLWCGRTEPSRVDRVKLAKELLDAQAAVGGILDEMSREEPDVIAESKRWHLKERGLLRDEEVTGIEPAA